ncbi:hypothetical protein [uncultured Pelagimonas sp.]|uniref:hypothetical protein n=1 Tax=uncultured Pelagimonas sp. TaxID=1618102 RepID=UPI00261F465F|nr:hypothetical protein [uncultured Pelagimonas sp.]
MSGSKLKHAVRKLDSWFGQLASEIPSELLVKLLFAFAFSTIGGGIVAVTSDVSFLMAFLVIFAILVLCYVVFIFEVFFF